MGLDLDYADGQTPLDEDEKEGEWQYGLSIEL